MVVVGAILAPGSFKNHHVSIPLTTMTINAIGMPIRHLFRGCDVVCIVYNALLTNNNFVTAQHPFSRLLSAYGASQMVVWMVSLAAQGPPSSPSTPPCSAPQVPRRPEQLHNFLIYCYW